MTKISSFFSRSRELILVDAEVIGRSGRTTLWALGEQVPDNQRGPLLRALPELMPHAPLPPWQLVSVESICRTLLGAVVRTLQAGPADISQLMTELHALVRLAQNSSEPCRVATDNMTSSVADMFLTARSYHSYQQTYSDDATRAAALALDAASSPARQFAAAHNMAVIALRTAHRRVYRNAAAGLPFPIEPWITAAGASLRAYEITRRAEFAELSLDAYENALRASRAETLTRAHAHQIDRGLRRFRSERARYLRARLCAANGCELGAR